MSNKTLLLGQDVMILSLLWGFDILRQLQSQTQPRLHPQSSKIGRPPVSFEKAPRSIRFEKIKASPLQIMTKEEFKVFFDGNMETLEYLVEKLRERETVKKDKRIREEDSHGKAERKVFRFSVP